MHLTRGSARRRVPLAAATCPLATSACAVRTSLRARRCLSTQRPEQPARGLCTTQTHCQHRETTPMLQQHTTPASAKANAARASTAQAMPGISLTLNRLGRLTDSVSGCFGSLDASHWQCTPQPNQPASPPTEKRPSVNVSPRSAGEDHCVVEKIHEPSASSFRGGLPSLSTSSWRASATAGGSQ